MRPTAYSESSLRIVRGRKGQRGDAGCSGEEHGCHISIQKFGDQQSTKYAARSPAPEIKHCCSETIGNFRIMRWSHVVTHLVVAIVLLLLLVFLVVETVFRRSLMLRRFKSDRPG